MPEIKQRSDCPRDELTPITTPTAYKHHVTRDTNDKPSYQRATLSSLNKHSPPKSPLHSASSDNRKHCSRAPSQRHPPTNVPVGILKKG